MADRTVSYVFKGNFSNLAAGLSVAGKSVQDYSGKLTALDKQGLKMRAGLTQVGDSAGKIGLAAGVGLAAVIGVTAKFDKAMSAVQAATHETASNMDLLRKAAVKAGAETVYSASESAGAIEELAKAGVSTRDILNGGLTGSLNLAAAGGVDVADAAETAATALTQFRLSGSQVPHVADLLAAGAGKAQGGVDDLGMALKQSGLVASQFGLSIDETVGTLAAFASAGLIGSDAGTSFKQSLLQLANPSQKSANLMDSLGIAAYDAGGKFVGMANLAGQLQAALKDKTQAERDSALATIFGSDAIRVANVLYKQGASGIQDWISKTNDSGYAAKTAATRLNNLSGDLEQLKGSLETALIGAGEGSQGPLRQLVQGVTAAVNAFNALPGPLKNVAVAGLAVTAVFGGGLWFTAKTINGVVAMKTSMQALGLASKATAAAEAEVAVATTAMSAGSVTAASKMGLLKGSLIELVAIGAAIKGFGALMDKALGSVNVDTSKLNKADEIAKIGKSIRQTNDGFQGAVDSVLGKIPIPFADTATETATKNIKQYDEALKGLVEGGHTDAAASIFAKITASAKDQGSSVSDVAAAFPEYRSALKAAASTTDQATASVGDFGVGANKAAEDAKLLADAMRKQRQDARGVASSFIDLGSSLDNTKSSLSSWIGQMEKQAQALRDFTKNAQIAGKRGLRDGLIAELEAAGPAGATRLKQLADASDSEIHRANRAWKQGQDAIRAYVNMKVPPKKAEVDVSQAQAAVSSLKAYLDSLHDRNIHVNVATSHTNATIGELAANQKHAAGGYIVGPGGPRDDKIPARLSNGEFVVNAATTARLRPWLEYENAKGFAKGGAVGPTWQNGTPGHKASTVDDLASSLDGKRAWDGWTRSELHAVAAAQKAATVLGTLHGVSLKVIQAQTAQAAAQIKGAKSNEEQTKVLDRLRGTTLKQAKAYDEAVKKQVAREKEAVTVETDHKNAILDDMAAVKESIASRYRSDVFGGVDASSIAYQIDPKSGKYVDKAQSSILQSQAVLAGLQKDIANAKANKVAGASIQAELKGSGLTKDQISNAVLYAQQNASIEQLQALASNKSLAREYASLYGQRQEVTDTTGQAAANMVFGQALATTNTHLAVLSADYKEGLRRQHTSNAHLNELEKRMKNLENLAKSNPEATGRSAGKHVGEAINSAAKGKKP